MAEVWLGTDEVLGRQVAIKLLHPNLAHDATFVERLRREAVAVAHINHPAIVAVYDTVSDEGHEAVVMEYVPGQTLRQLLDERGRLDVDEVVLLGTALADALDAAHRAGIVHRDVKPGNVLVTPEGRVRLTDFGIATGMWVTDELGDDGVLLGTAKYVAPEQVQGHRVDGRSDLYSLALVLTECLTGAVPFEGETERATALARLRQVPAPVRTLRPDVPPALDALLASALRTKPSDRPSTAGAFRDALARVPLDAPPSAPTRDATAVLPADRTKALPVDRTPPLGLGPPPVVDPPPGEPDALVDHQRRVRRFVLGLIAVAAVASVILFVVARKESARGRVVDVGTGATTTAPAPGTTAAATTVTAAPRPAGDIGIVSAAEFDPPPGDGKENPEQLGMLTDGRESTSWSTACYRQRRMAPKQGVGFVLLLSASPGGHRLVLSTPNRGVDAAVYVAKDVRTQLRDWGKPVSRGRNVGPGPIELDLGDGDAGRYVLVWFTDLGEPTCSSLSFQLRVGEVTVVKA